MNRKTIYCELDYWKEFLKLYPSTILPNDEMIKSCECWINFFHFYCKSKINFDISWTEFQKLVNTDVYLKMLWKQSNGGYCDIECMGKEYFPYIDTLNQQNLDNEKLNAIYLTSKNKKICQLQSQDYGVIVINNHNIKDFYYLFKDNGQAIRKWDKNITDWDFLRKSNINICNSLIIVDNYIFSDKSIIDDNLLPLLNIILPYNLNVPFTISIFSSNNMESGKAKYEYLKSEIKKMRDTLDFTLTIYACTTRDFHDRAIITNNVWIGCAGGFDLFKNNNSIKTTTISVVFPFIQSAIDWADGSYENLIKDAIKINNKKISNNDTNYSNYWSDNNTENRLLTHSQN